MTETEAPCQQAEMESKVHAPIELAPDKLRQVFGGTSPNVADGKVIDPTF